MDSKIENGQHPSQSGIDRLIDEMKKEHEGEGAADIMPRSLPKSLLLQNRPQGQPEETAQQPESELVTLPKTKIIGISGRFPWRFTLISLLAVVLSVFAVYEFALEKPYQMREPRSLNAKVSPLTTPTPRKIKKSQKSKKIKTRKNRVKRAKARAKKLNQKKNR